MPPSQIKSTMQLKLTSLRDRLRNLALCILQQYKVIVRKQHLYFSLDRFKYHSSQFRHLLGSFVLICTVLPPSSVGCSQKLARVHVICILRCIRDPTIPKNFRRMQSWLVIYISARMYRYRTPQCTACVRRLLFFFMISRRTGALKSYGRAGKKRPRPPVTAPRKGFCHHPSPKARASTTHTHEHKRIIITRKSAYILIRKHTYTYA